MKRFFQRIDQKKEDPAQAPILTVAFGDSVTQGVMEYGRLFSEGVYHRLFQIALEQRFCETTFSTLNAGVSGSSATQAVSRLERDVIRHHPDLVLLAFGLNDCLEGPGNLSQFSESLRTICAAVRSKTSSDLIILTPPFMAHRLDESKIHPKYRGLVAASIVRAQCEGFLDVYADELRSIACSEEAILADVHALWGSLKAEGIDTDTFLCNGLNHPNGEGQRMISNVLLESIPTLND